MAESVLPATVPSTVMRGYILLVFCMFGIMWSCQAILDNKERVEVVVNQLAAVVEDVGAGQHVRELTKVLLTHGEDRDGLVREILSFIKKQRTEKGEDQRILPQGIIQLLKSRVGVEAKRLILDRIIARIDSKNESVNKMEANKESMMNSIPRFSPARTDLFPTVKLAINTSINPVSAYRKSVLNKPLEIDIGLRIFTLA